MTAIPLQRLRSANALLAIACLAQFMVLLDVAIVNVALPSIRDGLGFSTTGLQWVVNAYTLTFAGLLLLGGRSADLLGHRRVFVAGTALFAIASLGCALATSSALLVGARALQGVAGALVSPATLAIVTTALPEGPQRNRGLGMWGAMGALGASSGALIGGVLTQALGWEAIFAVNVPLGIALAAAGAHLIPNVRSAGGTRHFDVAGATLVTAGLIALTYGIVRTDTLSWGAPGVVGPLAAAAILLAGFVLVEGRIAQAPLMPLSVLRHGQLVAANLVVVLLYAAFFPVWFFLTLYLQQVHHYGAIATGVSFLPMTLSIFAASALAPRAVARLGARAVITLGMVLATAGLAVLTGLAPGDAFVGPALAGGVLTAIGFGCSLVPATIVAVRGLPASESGLGSGLLNTSRLLGGALGLAVLSTIAAAHTRAHAGAGTAQALTDGFGLAFQVGTVICAVGALAAALLLREPRPATAPRGARALMQRARA
jgi:EmrB/QacA subfamily drug resistance transporter